ncbi:MAG: hypothetical protein QOF89_792 [Acidobacteriota bacterium]|jgi:hypothetical protein|nr:hypothetical protein [Acidobacteriota bacterium]
MSGIELEVVFHGMCTFVPDYDNRRMWVFLIEGNQKEQSAKGVPLHASFIRFGADQLSKKVPGNVLMRLSHCRVEIDPIHDVPLEVACSDWKKRGCPKKIEERSEDCFSWVAPVEEACAARGYPGGGELDIRFTEPLLSSQDRKLLGARFLLTAGRIATASLQSKDEKLLVSRFRPFGGNLELTDLTQFTASSVKWVVKIPSQSVNLKTFDLKSGKALQSVTLSPRKRTRSVVIDVLNEEADFLVGLKSESPFIVGMPRPQDRGFETVYSVCSTPPDPEEQPIPVSERLVESPFGENRKGPIVDGSPPCNPHRLELGISEGKNPGRRMKWKS